MIMNNDLESIWKKWLFTNLRHSSILWSDDLAKRQNVSVGTADIVAVIYIRGVLNLEQFC
jgi:hypothetical protein